MPWVIYTHTKSLERLKQIHVELDNLVSNVPPKAFNPTFYHDYIG